ncbi:hypothetical protein NE237_030010 [Protea cynaroides]|uniref:Uncharacterized protein n=1 Tax=Protea cynaroides TaxID=273540 RepID=A0A9Q0JWT3_9MAGN|nr:hypothetical protein NE237_030010 [Protea cynaroides]
MHKLADLPFSSSFGFSVVGDFPGVTPVLTLDYCPLSSSHLFRRSIRPSSHLFWRSTRQELTDQNLQSFQSLLNTSRFFAGDGFAVYDNEGEVLFRVDFYSPDARLKDELVLMDASGKCLITVRIKRRSHHQRWEGFLGERCDRKKPIFSEYQIEGSFPQRCCTFYNNTCPIKSKEPVAKIGRKVDSSTKVVLGKEVFSLCLKPGFDVPFAMGFKSSPPCTSGRRETPLSDGRHVVLEKI